MDVIDPGFYLWLAFRILLAVLVVLYLLSGVDELVVGLVHYLRRMADLLLPHKPVQPFSREQMDAVSEQRVAIAIPAWNQSQAISRMLLNTCSTMAYRNFHLFVGTYPNDERTKLEVEKVREVFPNIEVVVNPVDGPAPKTDCLNWIFQGILLYEKDHGVHFDILVCHDAEDVIHPLSLKYYNYLIPRVDFIQLPVYPLEREPSVAASMCMDTFAAVHTQDERARELFASTIPVAGLGVALSRAAVDHLAGLHHNQVFPPELAKVAYPAGQLLQYIPGRKMILAQHVERRVAFHRRFSNRPAQRLVREPVATRAIPPDTFASAVRDRSQRLLRTIRSGLITGWTRAPGLNYCLYRDRKEAVLHLLMLPAALVAFYMAITQVIGTLNPARAVPSLLPEGTISLLLLAASGFLFAWRCLHRILATGRLFGFLPGLLALPRLVSGFAMAFAAGAKTAAGLLAKPARGEQETWTEGHHAYPTQEQLRTFHRKIGDLLLERRLITTAQLEAAMTRQQQTGQKLGQVLMDMGALWEEDLIMALASQRNEKAVELDPLATPADLLQLVPRKLAESRRIFPLQMRGPTLVLASDAPDLAKLAGELAGELHCPVELRATSAADIQFAIKRAYATGRRESFDPRSERLGQRLVNAGYITDEDLRRALRTQKRTHQKLGEILVELKLVNAADMNDLLREP